MDMTASIEPKSDQLDAVDLLAGPRTFTIASIGAGTSEQPVNIGLAEFPRVWRPSKSMRRVLVAAWGADGSAYVGKRLTLYCDPTVMFGGIAVGGTRISEMSGISKALPVSLLIKRGQSSVFTVKPLADAAPTVAPATAEEVAACTEVDELRAMWATATPAVQALITARKAELDATAPAEGDE